MAVTISPKITGQEVTGVSYSYLYEPLEISVSEDDSSATKIYIDLEIIDFADSSNVVKIEEKYGNFDIDDGITLTIDLSEIMIQYHDANVFKIGSYTDIQSLAESVVSKYKYKFKIYSDTDSTGVSFTKFPIIGGRRFREFTPVVNSSTSLTEGGVYSIDFSKKFKGFPYFTFQLSSPSSSDARPSITLNTSTLGCIPKGGMVIWKSRLGGWMQWGMDISTYDPKKSYSGNLPSGLFQSGSNGNPYIATNYTKITTSYSFNLKALSLSQDELMAVSGINESVAVYYLHSVEGGNTRIELMRLDSASAPVSSLTDGGDFTVKLSSISSSYQKSR